jgi:hypothetical protein
MLSDKEFAILDYMDLYKVASEQDIEADVRVDSALIDNLSKNGFIRRIKASDVQIEAAGEKVVAEHRRLILEQTERKDELLKYCDEFEKVNKTFKALVTRWQMKDEYGIQVPNNHRDPEYDLAIIRELVNVHEETKKVIGKISEVIPTYQQYVGRFELALRRLTEGNPRYMDQARDSYHSVWFELHESLLKLSGIERTE